MPFEKVWHEKLSSFIPFDFKQVKVLKIRRNMSRETEIVLIAILEILKIGRNKEYGF